VTVFTDMNLKHDPYENWDFPAEWQFNRRSNIWSWVFALAYRRGRLLKLSFYEKNNVFFYRVPVCCIRDVVWNSLGGLQVLDRGGPRHPRHPRRPPNSFSVLTMVHQLFQLACNCFPPDLIFGSDFKYFFPINWEPVFV